MADTTIPRFLFEPSPLEMSYTQERLKQGLIYDPYIQDVTDAVGGEILIGARPTATGIVGTRAGYYLDALLEDSASDPLNFTRGRDEFDPLRDPVSFSLGNNLDGLTEDLQDVPTNDRAWILSAPNYNEYQRRLTFTKMNLPEVQALGSGWGFALGLAGDAAAMTALGLAAEPIAIAGLGARTTLAGRTVASSQGTLGVQQMANAAAEAAGTIGRMNLTARFAALGVAEEVVYQSVKNGLDPTYNPEVSEVVFDLAFSGSVAGILGGAVFGRAFAREAILEAAGELKATRQTTLPGGYTISYGRQLPFDSAADADQALLSAGSGSFDEEATKIGERLFDEWEQSPVEAVFTTETGAAVIPPSGTPFRYSTADGARWDLTDAGTVRPSNVRNQPDTTRVFFVSTRGAENISSALEMQVRFYGQTLDLVPNADNTVLSLTETAGPFAGRARRTVQMSSEPRPGMVPVTVAEDGAVEVGDKIVKVSKTKVGPQSFRSTIKTVAFEISLAGGRLSKETFAMIAKALVTVHRRGLKGGAFNKALWQEVSRNLDPAVAAALAPKKPFIGGVDRTVLDLVEREQLIDTITSEWRAGAAAGFESSGSLIFRVLGEISSRGGTVNRETVAEVIDTLRGIAQNPPRRLNKAGKSVVDKNKRRLAVAQLINKFADSRQQVFIPESLLSKLKSGRVAAGSTAAGRGVGTAADFGDTPKVASKWDKWWSMFGNQSARLMRSENPVARTIGWHAFHAKRVFDKAQPQTIFEAGTQALHGLMFTFLRGYRQGLAKFAMGDDAAQPTLKDMIRTWGRKEMRREFHKRVFRQMRTGAFDDASEAINETARGFRELMQKVHNIAHAAGLKGFQNSAVANYVPRLWRFDLIRRLATTENGKQALISLFKKSLDQNGRRVVVDGVEQTLTGDIDAAATAFANRLIAIAKNTENAPLIEQEQELADALLALQGPIKGKGPSGGTPFGRTRTLLDETAGISTTEDFLGTGRLAISIEDLTNDDLPFVMRKYLSSIMGAVNQRRMITAFNDELRARGVFSPKYTAPTGEVLQNQVEAETVEEMIALAKKIGGNIEGGAEEGLRELMAAIRYEPIHSGPLGLGSRLLSISLNYGYLTTGGQFGLAALGELSRIVGTLGILRTIRQMPVLLEMVENWKNLDRDNQNFASLIDSWFSPSTDRLRRVFMEMTPTGEYAEGITGAIERGLNSASQVLSDISGLAPITSFTQQLTAATTLQHLYDVARTGKGRLDDATVRALGLEPEQYTQIIDFVKRNAQTRNGWMGERIVGMDNIDAKDMDLIKTFVQRMVESRIQSVPTRGDLHKSAFTMLGRLVTQFRTFNLKGVDNFLIQNAERAGRGGQVKVIQEISATLMFAGTIQYLRTYADWRSQEAAGDWEKAKETESRLGIPGFIRGAFTGPSEFFVPALLTDTASNFLVGDPVFSPYRYSGLSFYGFPGQAQASNIFSLLRDAYGAGVGKPLGLKTEREITQGTVRRARMMIFGQNLPGIKQYFNIKEAEIEEAYNLPSQQPRRKRD